MDGIYWLAAGGICLDLSGAFWLARSAISLNQDSLINNFRTYAVGNPSIIAERIQSGLDARFGIFQIMLGFFLQLLASFNFYINGAIFSSIVISIGLASIYYHFWARNERLCRTVSVVLDSEPQMRNISSITSLRESHLRDYSDLEFARLLWNEGYMENLPATPPPGEQ